LRAAAFCRFIAQVQGSELPPAGRRDGRIWFFNQVHQQRRFIASDRILLGEETTQL